MFMLEDSLFQVLDLPGPAAQKSQIQADAEAMKKREFIEAPFLFGLLFVIFVAEGFIQFQELKGLRAFGFVGSG